jgi:hypothetical protein
VTKFIAALVGLALVAAAIVAMPTPSAIAGGCNNTAILC